jgi:ribonuclease Y
MDSMNSSLMIGAISLLSLLVTFAIFYSIHLRNANRKLDIQRLEVEKQLAEARRDADEMVKNALREAKEIALREGRDFDRVQRDKNQELQRAEKRLQKREETLDKKVQQVDQKEKDLKKRSDLLDREEKKASESLRTAEKSLQESQEKLESIAILTREEARRLLMESLESEVRKSAASEVKRIEDEARKSAEDKAKAIIATSIQRLANEFVTDACVSVVSLPTDDMKGRIIGREGRNIRAIEQATGVDLIIDDTPEAVIVSCFNPVRREVAKVAIERLVADGRIHPARIDEVVQKVSAEFNQMIQEAGERSSFDCGIQGLHPELITALGKLKYRTTGQQSVLQHSIETAQIAGVLAAELDLNVRLTKRAALLHDIGKSIDEESEGNHTALGAELAQKCGEAPEVIEAIAKHHVEYLQSVNPITVVVQAANVLSSFRPGARKEFLEKAIGRLKDIESMVQNLPGIEQAFVIKSGREIRAMVSPSVLDDDAVTLLAKSVAKKIRSDLNYPGQVKVTMVKETKVTEFAK